MEWMELVAPQQTFLTPRTRAEAAAVALLSIGAVVVVTGLFLPWFSFYQLCGDNGCQSTPPGNLHGFPGWGITAVIPSALIVVLGGWFLYQKLRRRRTSPAVWTYALPLAAVATAGVIATTFATTFQAISSSGIQMGGAGGYSFWATRLAGMAIAPTGLLVVWVACLIDVGFWSNRRLFVGLLAIAVFALSVLVIFFAMAVEQSSVLSKSAWSVDWYYTCSFASAVARSAPVAALLATTSIVAGGGTLLKGTLIRTRVALFSIAAILVVIVLALGAAGFLLPMFTSPDTDCRA